MSKDEHCGPTGCEECKNGEGLDFDFTMAFQPIVNCRTREIFAHEALVRGLNNEGAGQIFEHVNDSNRYRFDQACRTKAIKLAAELGMKSLLSINFMPNAVYRPELCIRTTLAAAEKYNFPIEQIIFEITESEKVDDLAHVRNIVDYYRQRGFKTAIDDFGAGYAGLNLLAEIQTDIMKLDMALLRNIDTRKSSQIIVRGIVQVCAELGMTVVAEGIETHEEYAVLRDMGIDLFQGYYFARPAFQSLAQVPAEVF
ncbi:EAL domain-containing protein [Cellvibrio sp. KY-YJ-3]|jgi:EAL domain-containing protein (putative c-di-GMP-specific phosphodiesterase class I)|uniref:EAL domain-containing protein n=1 Tax=Cellvibrio sp. KY-YJ-3 TaxID=454662 RepID=UPI00124464E5|nr:EAL domain-containing protein [Cellvibrio sp. KY-YJ-3]QEY14129.1 EAL domain-containing protein [Cellvibrio sp. KY-YJ-3]